MRIASHAHQKQQTSRTFRLPGFVFILVATLALHNSNASEVNVCEAVSLTHVMKEIAANYKKATANRIVSNFAASPAK
jgi:ABC-type molybdate transport system substrate-binding protein